jgi:hypothetical protein
MLNVPALPRTEIDSWPIAESGLPPRVVNATRPAGLATVGQLRAWTDAQLLNLRSVGRVSLEHIHYFFRVCDRVERGTQQFLSVQEAFDIFLDRAEQDVLFARYGLDRALMEASRQAATLQEIGNLLGITRERIRQVEESALAKLSTRLARVCLQPFSARAGERIRALGGIVSCGELATEAGDPSYGGHNPCGVLLLLHDTGSTGLVFYHGCFSTLPAASLAAAEAELLRAMAKNPAPTPARRWAQPAVSAITSERVLATLLDHAEGIAATRDGRFFPYEPGIGNYMTELLGGLARPAHYRQVTEAYNDSVKDHCRKGAGFILDALRDAPGCVRTASGFYDLAPRSGARA